jgi:hypothetical protein
MNYKLSEPATLWRVLLLQSPCHSLLRVSVRGLKAPAAPYACSLVLVIIIAHPMYCCDFAFFGIDQLCKKGGRTDKVLK